MRAAFLVILAPISDWKTAFFKYSEGIYIWESILSNWVSLLFSGKTYERVWKGRHKSKRTYFSVIFIALKKVNPLEYLLGCLLKKLFNQWTIFDSKYLKSYKAAVTSFGLPGTGVHEWASVFQHSKRFPVHSKFKLMNGRLKIFLP